MDRNNLNEIVSSMSQSTLATNIINNFNPKAIPLDSRYYFSTMSLSKKLPLTKIKNFNPSTSVQNIFKSDKNNTNKLIKSNSAFSIYSSFNKNNITSKIKNEIESYTKKQTDSLLSINNKNITSDINNLRKQKSLDDINIKVQMMEHFLRKQREKMNRTKFKFFKIVMNNDQKECAYFKEKNERFNERLKFYFKSNFFYKINKVYHNRFHFGKNYLNMGNDITKQYIAPSDNEQIIKLNSDLVLSLLNKEDINLIHSDPYFFLKDNQYLYKLTKTKFKSLINRFKEEDAKMRENENIYDDDDLDIEIYKKNKPSHKNQKYIRNIPKLKKSKTIKEEIPFLDKKYINKMVNEDLNKRLKHLKSGINPVEKEMINTEKKLNTYKNKNYLFEGNKKFYKTYHIRTNEDYFKPYSLEKNRERLIKETLFSKAMNKKNFSDNKDQGIIKKYQKQLEEYYSKANINNKRFNN